MSDEILAILVEQQRTLGQIDAAMKTLVGNGQPGIIKELREDVDSLKQSRSYGKGVIAAFVALEGALHYLLHKFGLN